MQCSHIHFQVTSTGISETLHDGLLRLNTKKKNNRKISSIILALNAMKASVDSIEKDSNSVIVVALVTGPIVSQSLVRIKD